MLNEEDTKTLNEYFGRHDFSEEVVNALRRYCTAIKEARPDAVLYTTKANILFRTVLSRNGSAFSLNPKKDTFCFCTDEAEKPKTPEFQLGQSTRYGWEFIVVCSPCKNHPTVTDEDFFQKAIGAGIECWDLRLEYERSKKQKNK